MSISNKAWKTKTDFSRTASIGYIIDEDTIIIGEISHQTADKIFVIFKHDSSDIAKNHFGRRYRWIMIPNENICSPIYHKIPPIPKIETYSMVQTSYTMTNVYYSNSYILPIKPKKQSYFTEVSNYDNKSDIRPTYGPRGKKIYRNRNKFISCNELSFINLKRPSFDICTQPTYYIDDDNEWIIFIKGNIIYKYVMNKNKYIQFPFSKKKLIKNGKHDGLSENIRIVTDIGNKSLFIFNEYGIIKQLYLERNKWIDHNVGDLDDSSECIGCYIPEPFNVLYIVSNTGNHYIYHSETRTLKLLKMDGVYIGSGSHQLLYCRSLKRLLLFNCDSIYYLNLNQYEYEITENVNWKSFYYKYLEENVICTVLYKYILFILKEKKIYCLDLKYWKHYESNKECSILNAFAERNNNEQYKYGLVVNDGTAHLFSKSTHIKIDLDVIIPEILKDNYYNGNYICFMIPYCPMLINGFIKQFEKNTNKIVPQPLCDLITQFYPICVL